MSAGADSVRHTVAGAVARAHQTSTPVMSAVDLVPVVETLGAIADAIVSTVEGVADAIGAVADAVLRFSEPLGADELEAQHEAMPEPCGSWRVLGYEGGYEADVVWCPRRLGPCPFPNTPVSVATVASVAERRGCAADG